MYVNRILIFLLVVAFLLGPAYQAWIVAGESQWYRVFLLWIIVIALAYVANQSRNIDDI